MKKKKSEVDKPRLLTTAENKPQREIKIQISTNKTVAIKGKDKGVIKTRRGWYSGLFFSKSKKGKKTTRIPEDPRLLNASYFSILFPVAGMLHDHELVRLHHKRENKFFFWLKVFFYTYLLLIMMIAGIMYDCTVTRIGNFSLILVPIYTMSYTTFIFSNKFGRFCRRSRDNTVRDEHNDNTENAANTLVPEDAIFQRLRRAQN